MHMYGNQKDSNDNPICKTMCNPICKTMCNPICKRDTDIKNRPLDYAGEDKGGMI